MSMKKRPVFNFKLCVSCSICVQSCPVSCIELTESAGGSDKNLYPAISGVCLGCSTCERACPIGAVSMEEID